MVEVRERAEELLRAASLVANHKSELARAFDLEYLDDRPEPRLHVPHNTLVDLERVLARLLEEDGVRHRADVGLAVGDARSRGNGETSAPARTSKQNARTYPSVRVDAGGFAGKLHFVTK